MPSLRIALRASVLLLAVLVASCDTRSPDLITAPGDALTSKAPGLVRAQAAAQGRGNAVAHGLISSDGGSVTSGAHSISVPNGAVNKSTTFSITALDEGYVEVYLTAIENAGSADEVNVGAQGFANGKTVTLTLSYAEAADVTDPTKLVIVRYLADGELQTLPVTHDAANQTISAQLGHFSKYAMATH
jgi:hypothetical protein